MVKRIPDDNTGGGSLRLSIDNREEELYMNIGALLPRHARYRSDHLALVLDDQRLT